MFVIAPPSSFGTISVIQYSDGPGKFWNCQPNSEPQNSRDFAVSSAGIS
jgi:hypothetical protein